MTDDAVADDRLSDLQDRIAELERERDEAQALADAVVRQRNRDEAQARALALEEAAGLLSDEYGMNETAGMVRKIRALATAPGDMVIVRREALECLLEPKLARPRGMIDRLRAALEEKTS